MLDGVVKIGGAKGNNHNNTLVDLANRVRNGEKWVLCHGVSGAMDALCSAAGMEPRYVVSPSGYRSRFVTDREMMLFEKASFSETAKICFALGTMGIPAMPIDPMKTTLVRGKVKNVIRAKEGSKTILLRGNRSGKITSIDQEEILVIIERGFLPIFPPLARDENVPRYINIDGDRLAGSIAASCNARTLVLLTNTPGLLEDVDNPESLIREITLEEWHIAERAAKGNMKRKLLACREALEGGLQEAIIADSRIENPITNAISGGGTHLWRARSTEIAV